MFRYIDNKNRTFLLGAYRGEKSQLEWILGEKPKRHEKLYNIRFNRLNQKVIISLQEN